MNLELADLLVCPRCGPGTGLVVLVERAEGRRVIDGRLDCPVCGRRFPLQDGAVRFDRARDPGAPGREEAFREAVDRPAAPTPEPGGEDRATLVAALFGIRSGRGTLILGPGLEDLAAEVSRLAGGAETVVLRPGVDLAEGAAVTPLVGASSSALPLLAGRAAGVALAGSTLAVGELEEGVRVLAPGGRLVVLEPPPGLEDRLSNLALEPLASDRQAIVARRT